ncbi:hypothetical protein BB561_003481 [Smittium simulii]|uniref:Threonine aspartase n=1 Tax=Smittium simulii TaxID=133385 RepID=A0A2T9YL88_9FUNG|nr:hypothetical protein BB561_003481 [Smittium simulii]
MKNKYSVFVHVGAGSHSLSNFSTYKSVMENACKAAIKALEEGSSSSAAVTIAIKILEDDPVTNAGIGSNLTRSGTVECDASIMCSKTGAFGAVGSVSAIKNPICAAKSIMDNESLGQQEIGLIYPMLLVGKGGEIWAKNNNIECTDDKSYHITVLFILNASSKTELVDNGLLQDTVGAICLDRYGDISSGVSSGGIALKYEGRVGEAAIYKAGCWAQKFYDSDQIKVVGASVTGTGEQIIRSSVAENYSTQVASNIDLPINQLQKLLLQFLDDPMLQKYSKKNVGIILMINNEIKDGAITELLAGHTTDTMGYGYMSNNMIHPKVMSLFSIY